MKNLVLLIVPPVTPCWDVLNCLHNFTPVGFYGPPEHQRAETQMILILMTGWKKQKLKEHFYAFGCASAAALPLQHECERVVEICGIIRSARQFGYVL